MNKCISIYPHSINDDYKSKVNDYISLAKEYGFNEVFTSIHLPEYSLLQQLQCLNIIANAALDRGLTLTVDIGGHYIDEILNNIDYLKLIKNIKIDFIRLDYGYDFNHVGKLYEILNIRGFVINASMYNEKEFNEIFNSFYSISKNIEIRACHNFYIREESGFDTAFALRQDSYLRKYNIPIYYCVRSYASPRGPIYKGLCTIEKHRNMNIDEVLCDLYLNYNINNYLMGDEWLSIDELKLFKDTLDSLTNTLDEEVRIKVNILKQANEIERSILLGKHVFRYDSPFNLLRSRSSRQMAEFGKDIPANNCIERNRGSITIDNSSYKRYSGELEVVLSNMDIDKRVNVVACINDKNDLIKLMRFREGHTYVFYE